MRDRAGKGKRDTFRLILALLTVLFSAPWPALAAKRMTAEQLLQLLTAAQSSHRKDIDLVQQLSDVELDARVSPAVLQQLLALSAGPKSAAELRALADLSAFLDAPADEIPSTPSPDFATQKEIIGKTVHYLARTLPTLPDFVATRVTEHYDDMPQVLEAGGWPTRAGLHLVTTTRMPIAFQDGRETDDPSLGPSLDPSLGPSPGSGIRKIAAAEAQPALAGLTSWGEFGPILGVVLVDAAKGKLSWARWEQLDGRPVAVFQFAVDRSVSHYNVQYCCVNSREVVGGSYATGGNGRGGGQQGPNKGMLKSDLAPFRQITGYHGTLTVDPDTGVILRIAIEADLKSVDAIQRAALLVEYGQVKIGDSTYTCPIRSISDSVSHDLYQPTPTSPFVDMVKQQLNEVAFTGYHRFGSESTLVALSNPSPPTSPAAEAAAVAGNATDVSAAPSAVPSAAPVASPASAPSPMSAPASAQGSAPSQGSAPAANLSASGSPAPAPPPIGVPGESDREILVKAVDSLPGMDANPGATAQPGFTLKVTTRMVDLGLVAFDKHNKPITDLRQDEIEVYDNGRKQQLVAFHHGVSAASAPPAQSPPPAGASDTFTNTASEVHEVQEAPDLLILLLDESHLAYQDLNRARGEVLRFLKATRPNSRVALYALSEHGFHILQDVTQDHALVMARLAAWMPDAQAVSQAQALDRRIRQQFDTVHNATDLNYVNGNQNEIPDFITPTDPELRLMGQNPLRSALETMIALARHFASVPGHKSLAWISGDSVMGDWEDQAVGMEKGEKMLDAALRHTKEALNEAHIALYAVDASAVQGDAVDASLENRNVQLNQAAQDNVAAGGGAGRINNGGAGRVQAQMQQDLHGIQGPVRQLAESTGGRAINKGGDLKAALDSIDQDSAALYELGFDPDSQADGKFHSLQIKVPTRKDVKLRYRTGYLYAEESAGTQQRFQQAVWSPQDATGVALTAEAVPAADSASGSPTVKLRIAFPGLALEQQDNRWQDNRWTDQLYIFVAVRDDATQKAEVSGDTLRLSLKQATYDSGMPAGIPYQRAVQVKSKLGSVRVLVVDGNSGKMGSVTLPSSALLP
jgi:VWFA-related protein